MTEYDIPVLFQVTAESEERAAEDLAGFIGGAIDLPRTISAYAPDERTTIESWHMPNHQYADNSDNPVRVVIVPLEPAYSERLALVKQIEELVQGDA